MAIEHRLVTTNGIRMHIAEAGSGPMVVLCHGFPELWYCWRHQIKALAAAGYHAVAPDMRGYGETEAPEDVAQYSVLHLVGDMVGLLDALEEQTAVIVGHDWGAVVAWHAALMRPDRFHAVAGLSVPFRPRGTGQTPPSAGWPTSEGAVFYQQYFQTPGVADTDLGRDAHATTRRILVGASGDGAAGVRRSTGGEVGMVRDAGGYIDSMPDPETLPAWLSEADIDYYADVFRDTGFTGSLNWYRNIDRNWELTAPYTGALVTVPALYMVGDRDLVMTFRGMDQLLANLKHVVPELRDSIVLPGCGHWTPEERPDAVNAALVRFLQSTTMR